VQHTPGTNGQQAEALDRLTRLQALTASLSEAVTSEQVSDAPLSHALAVTDPRAAGRVYNVAEPTAYTELEWVARIAEAAGWGGGVVTAPRGRLPVPFNTDQDLVTDSSRIRAELGYAEVAAPGEALRQTVARELENLPDQVMDYAEEDALNADLGL
jgi:uncharacterized protein YbjT (DUF2867 family)